MQLHLPFYAMDTGTIVVALKQNGTNCVGEHISLNRVLGSLRLILHTLNWQYEQSSWFDFQGDKTKVILPLALFKALC